MTNLLIWISKVETDLYIEVENTGTSNIAHMSLTLSNVSNGNPTACLLSQTSSNCSLTNNIPGFFLGNGQILSDSNLLLPGQYSCSTNLSCAQGINSSAVYLYAYDVGIPGDDININGLRKYLTSTGYEIYEGNFNFSVSVVSSCSNNITINALYCPCGQPPSYLTTSFAPSSIHFTSTCEWFILLDNTTTMLILSIPDNVNLTIDSPLVILSNDSIVSISPSSNITFTGCIGFGGLLNINVDSDLSASQFSPFFYQCIWKNSSFDQVQIQAGQSEINCGATVSETYGEESLLIDLNINSCNSGDGNEKTIVIIGVVVGVGGCVILVLTVVGVSVLIGVIIKKKGNSQSRMVNL